MFDSRWLSPTVSPREALLLLPYLPARTYLPGREQRWSAALKWWKIAIDRAPKASGVECVIVAGARVAMAAASGADLVLVDGRDRAGHLTRAGYNVRTYVARRAPAGAVVIGPLERGRARHNAPASGGVAARKMIMAGVRRATGRSYVTVARRGAVTPGAVRAALGSEYESVSLVAGGGGPRRRSAFVVVNPNDVRPHAVIKVGPVRWEARGRTEQRVLHRLGDAGLGEVVPRPLGEGRVGLICWSAESAAYGRPLSDVVAGSARPAQIRASLEKLAEWFGQLGNATRTARNWREAASGLPLRGEHQGLTGLRRVLSDVPGVLVHGDVGTGFNILVDRDLFHIIDWETSAEAELPLTDLLPLVCNALAAERGHRRASAAAEYVLRLCAGEEADSDWLLSVVRRYCRVVKVPLDQVGTLAALAWGYQASMRLVHEELVIEAGDVDPPWETSADAIARGWLMHRGLGLLWPALTEIRP